MDIKLNEEEVRVIGSLIEKKLATPEYYPLSLNALTNACNQKSNREPVVYYEEDLIEKTITSLRNKRFARMVEDGGRVPKYKENFSEELKFNQRETAALCVLMLRGPQTPGEIKNRSGRLCEFKSLEEIEETLQVLISREDGPFVVKLERQTGLKERRYTHLFSGEPIIEKKKEADEKEDRIVRLEQELETLKIEFVELRNQFLELKRELE